MSWTETTPRASASLGSVSRRNILRGSLLAAGGVLVDGCADRGSGTSGGTIRFLHNETDPPSIKFFKKAIKLYESKHPKVKIEMETVSTDGRLQRVQSLQAARKLPGVFKILPEERYVFGTKGVIEPLDDVVADIGRDRFVQGSVVPVKDKIYDIPYTINQYSVYYARTDLTGGIQPATDWRSFVETSQALTRGKKGDAESKMFGTVIPAALTRMTDIYFAQILWSEGGTFFDEDFNVALDSGDGAAIALDRMRALAEAAPPGIEAYSYSDMEATYLTGKIAQEVYAPRLVVNLGADAPKLLEKVKALPLLAGESGIGIGYANPNSFAVATQEFGNDNVDESKNFVQFLVSADRIREFSLTAYPHMIPPLKGVQEELLNSSNIVNDRAPQLARRSMDVSNTMDFTTEAGATVEDGEVKLTGRFNPYSAAVTSRAIGANMVQNVLIRGMDSDAAVAQGVEDLESAVEEMK